MYASVHCHTECVKALLDAGSNINTQTNYGQTLLILTPLPYIVNIICSIGSNTNAVSGSIGSNTNAVNFNLQDIDGNTALICASKYNYIESVKMLINAGSNVNIQDKYGYTALMYASVNGHTECVKILLNEKSININQQNNFGNTALSLSYKSKINQSDDIKNLIIDKIKS